MTVAMRDPVYRYLGRDGLIMEQQPLDGNRRVIDVFFSLYAEPVARLTAVAVDSVADAVQEAAFLSLYFDNRQLFQIIVEQDHSVHGILANVIPEVVAGACREIVHRPVQHTAAVAVDKMIQRAVAAGQHDRFLHRQTGQKISRVHPGNIPVFHLLPLNLLLDLPGFFFPVTVPRHGIVENVHLPFILPSFLGPLQVLRTIPLSAGRIPMPTVKIPTLPKLLAKG